MSTAAVRLIDLRIRRETRAFVRDQAHLRYVVWREQVETFKAIEGVRALLDHVPDLDWVEHFASNDDAYSSVIDELGRID